MNTLTHLLQSLINAFTRSRGTDVFVGLNDEPDSLFSFTYKKTGVDREWWCLGLYVVASPLQIPTKI